MKRSYILCALLALAVSVSAQLAWDTEFTKNDFNNAQTVISKTSNVSWSDGLFGLGSGISLGKTVIIGSAYQDECVIALPQTGIAEKLYFEWNGAGSGTITIYQSVDHNNWSQVFATEGKTVSLGVKDSVALATSTRYIKLAATGRTAAAFYSLRVSELKRLSASTDEWPFGTAMVDDAPATKNVTVNWTNIVATVSSTDPHFSASIESVGQKNLIEQSTSLTIIYSHAEAGEHTGEIVIAGEGREVRIAVSGTTNKYDQTLTWVQTLGECIATDHLTLNAFTSSGLEVIYESSDPTVAYVENSEVKIVRSGTVTLTATQPGNYKYNGVEPISKTLVIHKADPQIAVTAEDITYGQPLHEAVLQENMGLVLGSLTWLEIDTMSVLDAGDYVLQVLFTPADTGIYNLRTQPIALHVNKAPQIIVWAEQDTALTVGTPVPATAVLSSGLPITYAYTACLLSIENATVYPENEGEVTVVAYHPGNHNYLPTTVIMHTFTISAPQTPTAVDQLTPDQMRSAAKYLHAGQVYISYGGHVYDAEGRRVR